MMSIGELVRKGVDLNERGQSVEAFVHATRAFDRTLARSSGKEEPGLADYKKFIDKHWKLLLFLCFPAVTSPYLEVKFVVREISMNPRRNYTVKEIVVHLVTYALRKGRLPSDIGFTGGNSFEKKKNTLLVPSSLIGGLLSFVVVHPANKDETVPDKYWISIADFKMFVSELWGRIDLAERVRTFYLTR